MRRPPTCQRLPSAGERRPASRSRVWCRRQCNNTLSSIGFPRLRRRRWKTPPATSILNPHPRQAGCMAKTDKRRKSTHIPRDIERAIRAAEDKKATDLVALDLRKAAGFTDFFLLCTGGKPQPISAVAEHVIWTLG